jgi:hypothetical protein
MMNKGQRIAIYNNFMNPVSVSLLKKFDVNFLADLGFFTAPASTKYHGAYEGGLFDHSLQVAKELVYLTDRLGLEWQRPESPYIVGMFHDLCKCDNYVKDFESDKYVYNPNIIIPGHAEKSIIITQKFLDLTDEEIACIRWHMGAYEKDPKMWEYYGLAIESYPNVLYTHTADMIASKIMHI